MQPMQERVATLHRPPVKARAATGDHPQMHPPLQQQIMRQEVPQGIRPGIPHPLTPVHLHPWLAIPLRMQGRGSGALPNRERCQAQEAESRQELAPYRPAQGKAARRRTPEMTRRIILARER